MAVPLTDVDAVIDALGGTTAVALIAKTRPQSVSNWRRLRRFPCTTFLLMQAALHERDLDAVPSLWGMRE